MYVFHVELDQEKDGRWSATVPALVGCAAWGATRREAFDALREAAEAIVEVMVEDGSAVPTEDGVITHDVGGWRSVLLVYE